MLWQTTISPTESEEKNTASRKDLCCGEWNHLWDRGMTGDGRQLIMRLLYFANGWTGNGVEGSCDERRKY